MANVNSTLYQSAYVDNRVADARDVDGRIVTRKMSFIVPTSPVFAQGDTVNLIVIPKFWQVIDLFLIVTVANTATQTISLGDSGSTTRYQAATVMASVGAKFDHVASTAANYVPTADTIVFATFGVVTPTVGGRIEGWFKLMPPS